MQTTLRFDEALMRRIKADAAHQGMSLTRYIELALRERLRRNQATRGKGPQKVRLPVSRSRGGFASGVRDLKQAVSIVEDDKVDAFDRQN